MRASLSPTLSLYIARHYLLWFALVVVAMTGIIYFAEAVELLRRSASRDVPVSDVLEMAAIKVPSTLQEAFPFAVLVSGISAYWHLARFHEAVVARASGISVWQLLVPTVAVVLVIGVLRLIALDPVATALLARFQDWQALHITHTSLKSQASNGLWVRQADGEGETIIHAERVAPLQRRLERVWFVDTIGGSEFAGRIDADSAELSDDSWNLRGAWISRPHQNTEYAGQLSLPTTLSFDQIINSFADPKTVSLWRLPGYIDLMEAMGFSARNHRLQLQRLLATPLQLVAMLLLGTAFALRPHRFAGSAALVGLGLLTGLVLFLFSNILFSLARSLTIPIELAAWTPAMASTLLGVTLLLHLEDG